MISFFAFSAKVGQSEAPSSITGTICLPSTPPAALISSIASSSASFTETSLIDMVPLSECRMPTLISPLVVAAAGDGLRASAAAVVAAAVGAAVVAAPSVERWLAPSWLGCRRRPPAARRRHSSQRACAEMIADSSVLTSVEFLHSIIWTHGPMARYVTVPRAKSLSSVCSREQA